MIASIKGEVTGRSENDLVVQVGGLGFKIIAPKATCANCQMGDFINLFTYLVVRENALSLYGFDTREVRDFFGLLLSVNGIGPKTALSILSTLSVDAIINAVLSNNEDVFCQVPGIGRKSAQKVVLFMKDKVDQFATKEGIAGYKDTNSEVLDALVGLGYSIVEAQSAIQSIPKDSPEDLESRLRIALQYFSM